MHESDTRQRVHDVDADSSSSFSGLTASMAGMHRSNATPPPETMPSSNCGASRVQRVFDAGFPFLHFGLGRSADIDDGTPPASLARRSWSFSRS